MTKSRMMMWTAALLASALLFAGCGGDDDGTTEAASDGGSTSSDGSDVASSGGDDSGSSSSAGAGGTINLGGEEIAIERLWCYFEEQPRAGLGGVFTHTAQGEGVNADGEAVLLDFSRAVAEDGTVEFDLTVDVGDFRSADSVGYRGSGDEITFRDNSASVNTSVVNFDDFNADPIDLSFDLACG
jgi:hypothetical protein